MDASKNVTTIHKSPQWEIKTTFELPPWGEPVLIVFILFFSMFVTRRRNYSIFGRRKPNAYRNSYRDDPESALEDPNFGSSSGAPLLHQPESANDNLSDTSSQADSLPFLALKNPPKRRQCCGLTFHTPNSSRFAPHYHSRLLQKFPFLIEMFYWILTWLFYRLAKLLTNAIFTTAVHDVAQSHGLAILELEQFSPIAPLFPYRELDLQTWFLQPSHKGLLAVFNHIYSLVHIPATVAFIAWYYRVAPTHTHHFAVFRRTLTLENLLAFFIFTLYPTMPPRLLPPEHGFVDTVHAGHAESVWMSDGNVHVNSLAAMPSMHFGYAVVLGVTLVAHSGIMGRMWGGLRTLFSSSSSSSSLPSYSALPSSSSSSSSSSTSSISSSSRSSSELLDDEEKSPSDPMTETKTQTQTPLQSQMSLGWTMWYCLCGIAYPATILIAIIATANHYWLDAVMALVACALGYACNEVFLYLLPLEDLLLWGLRVEKPVPTTGDYWRKRRRS